MKTVLMFCITYNYCLNVYNRYSESNYFSVFALFAVLSMAIIKRVLCFIVGTLLIFTTPAGKYDGLHHYKTCFALSK